VTTLQADRPGVARWDGDGPPEVRGWPPAGPGPEPIAHEWAGPAAAAMPETRPRARHARPARTAHAARTPAPPVQAHPGRAASARLTVCVAGAHGGAGTSTLARLLRSELAAAYPDGLVPRVEDKAAIPDAHPQLLAAAGLLPIPPAGVPMILVARGTPEGARRAVTALAALERRRVRPAALAVVADGAGPEPPLAVQRFDLIAERCGPLIRVPFAAAVRAGSGPESGPAPAQFGRRFHRAITALAAATGLLPERGW
jgi:hypothetical protein